MAPRQDQLKFPFDTLFVKEITGDGVRSSSNVKVLRWIENGSVKEVFQQLYQWVVVDDERYKVLKSILPTGHMDRWNAVLEGVVKEAAKTAAYDVFFEPKMVSQKAVRAGLRAGQRVAKYRGNKEAYREEMEFRHGVAAGILFTGLKDIRLNPNGYFIQLATSKATITRRRHPKSAKPDTSKGQAQVQRTIKPKPSKGIMKMMEDRVLHQRNLALKAKKISNPLDQLTESYSGKDGSDPSTPTTKLDDSTETGNIDTQDLERQLSSSSSSTPKVSSNHTATERPTAASEATLYPVKGGEVRSEGGSEGSKNTTNATSSKRRIEQDSEVSDGDDRKVVKKKMKKSKTTSKATGRIV